jgi:integrase
MRSKGARIWLRPAYDKTASVWVIRDGTRQISTGCAPAERQEAERKLGEYIAAKHKPARLGGRDPLSVPVADVANIYLQERAPGQKRAHETIRRIMAVAEFYGDRTLAAVNGQSCREYAATRPAQAARRELEDFRAAINHYFADELLAPKINIQLPDKAAPRERWLTRAEAARLLWAAWRRAQPMPKGGKRYVAQHVARFILVGLYTGTRSAAICGAAIRPTVGRGYVDLERGVFYRRPPGTAETTKRQPYIRLPGRLLALLRRWERLGLSSKAIVEWEGQPVTRVSKSFARVAGAAGMADVSPHVLRHTAVTWAMQNGADPVEARGYFGLTEKTMNEVYLHHHPEHQQGVARAVSAQQVPNRSGVNKTRRDAI